MIIVMKIVKLAAHKTKAFSVSPLSMCVLTCFPILAIMQNTLSQHTFFLIFKCIIRIQLNGDWCLGQQQENMFFGHDTLMFQVF